MGVYCTVCMNNSVKNKNISFFAYPMDSVRRSQWLKAVGREDLVAKLVDDSSKRQQHRICEVHFKKSNITYCKSGKRKFLTATAFPTLNLPVAGSSTVQTASSSQIEIAPKRDIDNLVPCTVIGTIVQLRTEPNVVSVYLAPEIKTEVENIDLEDQFIKTEPMEIESIETESLATAEIEAVQRNEVSEKQEVTVRFGETKKYIDYTTKKLLLELCDKFISKGMAQIVEWLLDYNGEKPSEAFTFFALNLHYTGPAAYKFLANTFNLPSRVELQKLVKPASTKLDDRLLYALKTKVDKMSPDEKICSVSVGYMPVKPNLYYDISNDRIIGFHEVNGVQTKVQANYVVVVMIRGVLYNWKQPVAHSFVTDFNDSVNVWIEETIKSLLIIGLDIRLFISDLDSVFLPKSCSLRKDKIYFEVNGHKIYKMFDVPQLLRSLRDNLMTCDFVFDSKTANWSHIVELYEIDINRAVRLAPKLTVAHVKLNYSLNTKLASQVFSRAVATAISFYVDSNFMEVATNDTAVFVNKINNLYDVLNSNTLRSANKYKRAFSGKDYQIKFLKEMLTFFNKLKVLSDGQDKTNSMNFIHGFKVSINSLLQLHKDLKTAEIKHMFTRRLNRDCLERFFGKFKKADLKPTCRKLSVVFNKMFIINILKLPFNKNCDQDFQSTIKDNQMFKSDSTVTEITVGTNDYRFDLPKQNALLIATGYLYKKCNELHNCSNVKLYINRAGQTTELSKSTKDNDIASGFLIIPPDNFVKFVESLERAFRDYFDLNSNVLNIGNDILKRVQFRNFVMPCECFPIDYLKRLFIRFRIYHSVKRYNKLLKCQKPKPKLFRVDKL